MDNKISYGGNCKWKELANQWNLPSRKKYKHWKRVLCMIDMSVQIDAIKVNYSVKGIEINHFITIHSRHFNKGNYLVNLYIFIMVYAKINIPR